MQPESEKPSLKVIFRLGKKEKDAADSSSAGRLSSPPKEATNVPPAPLKASPLPEHDDTHRTDTGDDQSADLSKQIVLYDPAINGSGDIEPVNGLGEIDHVTKPDRLPSFSRFASPNGHPRVLPSVGTYTVQCANCFKWRLIPSKEKYEEIRENILENPFYCETAREWRPDVSCEDPEDISQDGSRLWAIDKPNIARPPPGWQRILRIRGEGGTKFADVYYVSPTGKRLRSMVEVQKYLMDHPEYINSEVTLSKFSFQIPKPLQENYVRKRPPRVPASQDVPPLSWAEADYNTDLQLETPALPAPPSYSEASDFDSVGRPAKKQARSNDP